MELQTGVKIVANARCPSMSIHQLPMC